MVGVNVPWAGVNVPRGRVNVPACLASAVEGSRADFVSMFDFPREPFSVLFANIAAAGAVDREFVHIF